jgi:hypothetical protein
MRKFNSYGPIDVEDHFFVERNELIQKCTNQLLGSKNKGGHYFTIWAPRQTGKTWIIQQSVRQIKKIYNDKFAVGMISMQGFDQSDTNKATAFFFKRFQKLMNKRFNLNITEINSWEQWLELFDKQDGLFKKPLILFIDEFDKLPNDIIDQAVSMFRELYLSRDDYMLHGLALIGVRAVLGVDSKKGSPFNVQRSLHIPNLTFDEVQQMFNDYQSESGQNIDPQVVQQLYDSTNGQPGLIGWFGELLTEKFNDFPEQTIDLNLWDDVYSASLHIEPNNTVRNMIIKAQTEYKNEVLRLFKDANIDFSFQVDWCNFMFMHGLITYEKVRQLRVIKYICRFSSPYVQTCLYTVFTNDVSKTHSGQVMAIDPLDYMEDVFDSKDLNIPALLERYKKYLKRLKDNDENPWANQPRRKTDFHLTEAVGHFHLYHWLKLALDGTCDVMPEFPTGNGKVDLHIKCKADKKGLIEVKSFVNPLKVNDAIIQASEYALQTNYTEITIAMFAPFTDEEVLNKISVSKTVDNVNVNVVAIGQG